MEDIIIYSVGALAVRGLRRAVFGPSREEKLSQEVEQLQGIIAQQNARLQQLEETLKLPAAQVPQDALTLALPGRPVVTSAEETPNGRHSPLKRPAPDAPSVDTPPVAKRSRWSIFPVTRRRNAEEPAQPPSSPSPSNRAAVVQSSSNPSTSTDQSASAHVTETSASESSGTSSSSDEVSDNSDAVDDSSDVEESSSEEEDSSSDEEESAKAVVGGTVAVSASATTSSSKSESEAEDEPSQVQSASKKSTSGSSGSSRESASQTPSTSGPSSSIKELSQAGSEAISPETSRDPNTSDDSYPASSVPDCTQPIMEVSKSVGDHSNKSEALSSDYNDSDDSSSDSDSKSEGSKDTEDSSSGDSDNMSEEIEAVNATVAPEEQPDLVAAEEQAALLSPAENPGADEVEGDSIEEVDLQMGAEEEVEKLREAQNRILCQVQEQIASAIYGLQIADCSLGEEEIVSDLQQMAAGLLPDSPQDAPEHPNQDKLPEQPLLSSDAGAAAAAALSDGVLVEEAADHLVADSTPSSRRNIEVAAANTASPTMGSPFVTAASMRSPRVLLDEHSGGDSRTRRSPKRRASDEDMSGEERRSRKRPRSLCSRLCSYLPRPLRMLRRFGGRGYWRGARRRASSTSDSSRDLAAYALEALLADPAETEEQATIGNAVMEQGSIFVANPDATGDEAADAATPGDIEPAQHEVAADAACSELAADSTRVPIQASGIFLTEDIAADDELSEEEKALLALADAEEQARTAILRFTQASATQNPAVDLDSHNFALGSPQKAPVDEEWGDLSPAPAVYGSNPAAAYSPSLCRQQDYSGLSQDEYARSLSPLDRRRRSRSRGRFGSEPHPSYSCGRSVSPRPEQGHKFVSDLARARRVLSLSPLMRRSPSEHRNGGSPVRSPSPRRSGHAQDHRSIPSLSPVSHRLRRWSVSKTSRSRSHSRGVSRGRGRSHSRDLSGLGHGRYRSSSPSNSPTKRHRRHTPKRYGGNRGTPSRSRSAEHAGRSLTPRYFGRHKGTPSHSRSAGRAGRSLSRGHSHGDMSPARRLRRRSVARSPNSSSRSLSRSLSWDGGWGDDFNKQSPRYASPSRSRSPVCNGTLEKELGSPSYSSYKKSHADATDGELRQLVRNCEDLKAAGDVAAHKAAKSPLLSQPGGRKRGVLMSPSRSPSPITSSPFTHPGAGIRLTDVQDTGYDVVGDGAEDRDEVNQDGHIIREDSPVQSNLLGRRERDAIRTTRSPDLRKSGFSPSPSPDQQQVRVRSAVWNPTASDASQRLRSVSRSRSRSPVASDGFGRSRGSPCKAQELPEPPSPQPPSVLLSDTAVEGDERLQWRPRAGTPVPDDFMVQRGVRTTLHSAEQPERNTLATQLARGLSDAWQHDMHLRRTRAAGSDDDQAPQESLFRRRMRFARRIFDRHRRRGPAGVSVMPRVSLFTRDPVSISHKLRPTPALFRSSVASAPAWMPMGNFENDLVEELVDLTQDDNEEDMQERQPPTDMSLNNNNNNRDPQPSYSQHQAGSECAAGCDVDAEAPRRPSLSKSDLYDAELERLLQQGSG